MSSTVDGLISGLDTTTLISQLMKAEAAPQQRLKDKVTTQQTAITAYQTVNTKFSALKTAADALIGVNAWSAAKATSSSDAVVASAVAGAPTGNVTFDVLQLAKAHSISAAVPATNVGTGSLKITIGAVDTAISTTDNTPQGIADAINAASLGVRASVVNTGAETRLQVTSSKTGAASAFTLTGLSDAPAAVAVAGTDAQIKIGDAGSPGGYTISSATNAFTNVIPGATLTVTRPQTAVSIVVKSDAEGLADKMQALADAVNAANTEVTKQTSFDAATKKTGALAGDRNVRQLSNNLLSGISGGQPGRDAVPASPGPPPIAASPAVPPYGSFQQLGLTLDRYGKVSFDKAKFIAAYEADPAQIRSAVSDGLAAKASSVAKSATDSVNGILTAGISGKTGFIKSLTAQIESWDIRLASRQEGLQKQFSRLEVALGKMKEQSSWLSGQISSLS